MTQSSNAVADASEINRVLRRGMVLAASTLGFGVIRLDVSVVNVPCTWRTAGRRTAPTERGPT